MKRDEAAKMLPVIAAFAAGKEIEQYTPQVNEWLPSSEDPLFFPPIEYRIKPEPPKPEFKYVDLECLIASGVDCEFKDELPEQWMVGRLISIDESRKEPYLTDMEKYEQCRPRLNHWYSWQGGECPLPEGLLLHIQYRDSNIHTHIKNYTGIGWTYNRQGSLHQDASPEDDIIAFKITGLADGWKYPWESEE